MKGMGDNLQALNRAFEKAFMHTATEETLMGLLSHLGEEISCDRISIFEIHDETFFDNTYEWCREGIIPEINLLQHLSVISTSGWAVRLMNDEVISIRDLETIRESDPEIYELFHMQGVASVLAAKLAFHGKFFGFCVLENPAAELFADSDDFVPGIRYILSSLLYSDHLLRKFQKIGYSDSLTGAGNRLLLQSQLEKIDADSSVGLIYCDVLEWDVEDGRPEHLEEQQMVIHTGEILQDLFDEMVFRVGTGEFLVICVESSRADFDRSVDTLRTLLAAQDLIVAIGTLFADRCDEGFDEMIRRAHLDMYNEKRSLSAMRQKKRESREKGKEEENRDIWNFQESADIHLARGDLFFHQADLWISQIFDEDVVTVVADINYFKLYNDIFGRKAGNIFLESVAEDVLKCANDLQGIAGYLGGDNFCFMFPTKEKDMAALKKLLDEVAGRFRYTDGFAPVFGAYVSSDRSETAIVDYDRALMALSDIRGSYTQFVRVYDREHFEDVRNNKLLLMDAKEGLDRKEFLFYLQPQVHDRTGKIIGAEALIRWNYHGQIRTPDLFIEAMEKSGYIYVLDTYIWESVCIWLHSLMARGIKPIPVSVNVSRVDFYFADIAQQFIGLTEKYGIDPSLLGVEITESSFTDNLADIRKAIDDLHRAGFHILMDDFGSGSSSLSMLHQMNVDVLKMDVSFMRRVSTDSRAVSIVEAIISMAHMMGLMVITEGIETEEQGLRMNALGDNYVQGYYFYEPMPVESFEALLCDGEKIGKPPYKGGPIMTERLTFREMFHEDVLSDSLLENIIGPAAIIRKTGDGFRFMQINRSFTQITGLAADEFGVIPGEPEIERTEKLSVQGAEGQTEHPLEGVSGELRVRGASGELILLKAKLFLLYSNDEHRLYMATVQEG